MVHISILQEMHSEYRLIIDEIESLNHYLNSEFCSEAEKIIFDEMLKIAELQKEQVGKLIDDKMEELSPQIGIKEITDLLLSA